MHYLASLLIPQEIFTLKGHRGPQSPGIIDTRLLRKFPCEINILRDLRACYEISGLISVRHGAMSRAMRRVSAKIGTSPLFPDRMAAFVCYDRA